MAIRPSDGFTLRTNVTQQRMTTDQPVPTGVGTLGMKLFIASLSFIFAASILLYLLLLAPEESPAIEHLPVIAAGVFVSTALILASSVTLRRGSRAVRADRCDELAVWLKRTLWLGYGFGALQTANWVLVWIAVDPFASGNRHAGFFIVLTIVHALHVVGGVVRLVQITRRAQQGEFSAAHHEPVTNMAMYWHFLDVVWLLLVLAIVGVSI
ncbi:Cytochrome c oxidase subunit 3 [Planctomycetes bacterium Pla163]|uniref:Cytochrome c oxidase subunit 3 n=1 Tax=Rohdeia mirabilis TaxID=2528008 RepID=A0A518CXX7_9BACT|nr:Cytochrome c oxidase subunit 3 [Planctomycetes bacterium Pla163]